MQPATVFFDRMFAKSQRVTNQAAMDAAAAAKDQHSSMAAALAGQAAGDRYTAR